MTAAAEAIRGLLTGPVRAARVVQAGPHAIYLRADPGADDPGADDPGEDVPTAGDGVFALLGPGAVRVPVGVLLDALPTGPAEVRIGDGAVRLDGVAHPVRRWWPSRVTPSHLLAGPPAVRGLDAGSLVHARLGRGPGLTPEGDDELAGMLVALAAAPGLASRSCRAALARAVLTRLDTEPAPTTDVSAALLRAACEGHAIPQLTRWLAEGCPLGTPGHGELLAVGHTSGAALARGVLGVVRPVEPAPGEGTSGERTHRREEALV